MLFDVLTGQVILMTINQILTAGIAITAFSLLLFSFQFNLKDHVARNFIFILACVVIVFTAEAISSVIHSQSAVDLWLRMEWVGVILLPATYLQFSNALLTTTGKPSRGKRTWAVRIAYLFSMGFLVTLPFPSIFGTIDFGLLDIPRFHPTIVTLIISIYYLVAMAMSWYNFIRAYQRTTTPTSQRRMFYLIIGALAPAFGSFPYMLFGAGVPQRHPLFFWAFAGASNVLVGGLVILMAYSVAFFGVSWTDRLIKSRLVKWILRGPVTASIALGFATIIRRIGASFGDPYSPFVPITTVVTILVIEYSITIFAPFFEKWLFYGNDRTDLTLLRTFEDRFLTRNDLIQFMELVLSAICDRLQAPGGFAAILRAGRIESMIAVGRNRYKQEEVADGIDEIITSKNDSFQFFQWGEDLVIPLGTQSDNSNEMLGLMGITGAAHIELDDEQSDALTLLVKRAVLALQDRQKQLEIFQNFQSLQSEVDVIQKIRAAGRYDKQQLLLSNGDFPAGDMAQWVKDALSHYWGGPRLTESPLLQLKVVRDAADSHEGSQANALRAILRQAIEKTRPEGERRFTAEWILYNILEMKFLEGRKVRDIAMRLAMSEADLYRKQRIAIETIAKEITDMEVESRINST
jgi:hypothetical protein